MQYHTWETHYQNWANWLKRIEGKKVDLMSMRDWTKFRITEVMAQCPDHIIPTYVGADLAWADAGSPYYKVHPKLISKLCKVNLEKVPAEFIETPMDLPAVAICLPDCDIPELRLSEKYQIKSLLIVKNDPPFSGRFREKIEEAAVLMIDFGAYTPDDQRRRETGFMPIWYYPGQSIAEAAEENFLSQVRDQNSLCNELGFDKEVVSEVYKNCIRLCVTIGFLANSNDEIIEPDVLS